MIFLIQILIDYFKAISRVPDQTPQHTTSDLGLHCMYTCACVHPRVCLWYKCASACGYMRAYMYVRACVRVSVRLVCVCM